MGVPACLGAHQVISDRVDEEMSEGGGGVAAN